MRGHTISPGHLLASSRKTSHARLPKATRPSIDDTWRSEARCCNGTGARSATVSTDVARPRLAYPFSPARFHVRAILPEPRTWIKRLPDNRRNLSATFGEFSQRQRPLRYSDMSFDDERRSVLALTESITRRLDVTTHDENIGSRRQHFERSIH